MSRLMFVAATVACLASQSRAQFVTNVFDLNSGANTYHVNSNFESLADSNWTSFFAGLTPNSGTQFLASGNGNAAHDFVDIGLIKNLGGVIQNHSYNVAFFIASYADRHDIVLQPVQFTDFSLLKIGGTSGTMLWTSTPTPVVNDQWYQWTGTYTPAASDVGSPFLFTAIFTLKSLHTIAIDGPITVPEPTSWLLLSSGLAALIIRRATPSKP